MVNSESAATLISKRLVRARVFMISSFECRRFFDGPQGSSAAGTSALHMPFEATGVARRPAVGIRDLADGYGNEGHLLKLANTRDRRQRSIPPKGPPQDASSTLL